ncbi:MAG: hypothetical protein Q8R92_02980 [Deltaproteobacteria bacterium]|nr:hypothetical protein [Deltaproteobacteria bacterium]
MSSSPVKITLSREAARYIRAGTPREVKLEAARGELALELSEWITVLYLLSQEPDDEIRASARERVRGIPQEKALKALDCGLATPVIDLLAREHSEDDVLLLQIANRPDVADETLAFLATLPNKSVLDAVARNSDRVLRSPAILEALGTNPLGSRTMVDKLLFLFGVERRLVAEAEEGEDKVEEKGAELIDRAATVDTSDLPAELTEDVGTGPDQRRFDEHNLMTMVRSLTVFQKIKLALLGNKEARGILVRDRNKIVCSAAVRNPKVTENEIVGFTKSKEMSEEVLRIIAKNRDWTKCYQVQMGLVSNPKTPLIYAMKFVGYLQERDLRSLAKSRDVPPQINAQARRLLNQKQGGR